MLGLPARMMAAIIAVPVLLIACAVFATATIESRSAVQAAEQQTESQALLTAMLDQETGARGYFQTGDLRFLQPYWSGQSAFAAALTRSRALAGGDASLDASLLEQAQQHLAWLRAAGAQIDRLERTGTAPTVADAIAGKATVDNFRNLNAIYAFQLAGRRDAVLRRATFLAVGVAVLLSALLVLGGIAISRRLGRQESRRQRGQQELRELLQVSASEDESQVLLIRHVERTVPGSIAAVLKSNNSDNRLEVTVSENAGQVPLGRLDSGELRPSSCLAIRLSRAHVQRPGDDPLMRCEACGKIPGAIVCEPLLVGGQVIGSVLVTREQAIDRTQRARVRESVIQAAPILANQRNLAVAERRAASDALTGLPNRRAADEAIKRMIAHAGRTVAPMSAVLLDLDHFKQINDLHGHDRGDKVLATIGQLVASNLRASDFAARYGGEEFLLLLPDTDSSGAFEVAEKLRRTIERAEVRQVGTLTASFGIATLPDDAVEPEQLLRKADRALYAAKARGRNRVEVAAAAPGLLGSDRPDLPKSDAPGSDTQP
jgi:diguanylate cyclase (GGDEF)-like protein